MTTHAFSLKRGVAIRVKARVASSVRGAALLLLLASAPLAFAADDDVVTIDTATAAAASPDTGMTDATGEEWTSVHVPELGLVYFRYGPPGGVVIKRQHGGTDTLAVTAAERVRLDQNSAELLKLLVRDEIRKYRELMAGETAVAKRDTTSPVERESRPRETTTIVLPGAGTPVPARVETVYVDRESVKTVFRDAPAPPPADEQGAVAIVDPGAIRRDLMFSGFLRSNQVLFEFDKDDVLPYSYPILEAVADFLREFPEVRMRFEGHTDSRGSAAYNEKLSRRRAESVRIRFIDALGIDGARLESAGYGETRLLVPGESSTAHALNRRVEFRVLNPEVLQ
ncbi:MAG: OmpA family protein [Gemmatimonadetes bacterium]|nr:OmpA family protein [Gemmatimonadota bacterium]